MTVGDAVREPRNLAASMGRWSAGHRKLAVLGWLAFVAIAFVLGQAAGTKKIEAADTGSGESRKAAQVLDKAGFDTPAGEVVLIQAPKGGSNQDAAFTAAVQDVVARVKTVKVVANVRSPLDNPAQLSKDGRSALVQFELTGEFDDAVDKVAPVLAAVAAAQKAHPALTIEEFGDASAGKALEDTIGEDFKKAEVASIPVTLVILLLAFGALVAAGLPLLLGLTSVMAALGLLALTSHLLPADEAANSVVLLIGLAVGVDYSLFYIKREREERAKGLDKEAALNAAAATSGRSVLVSGLTVLIAMAGMYFTGSSIFASIATGTILVVAISVLGSLTVLPALLSMLGDRVDKGRIPFLRRLMRGSDGSGESRFWGWTLSHVLRHPVISAVLSGGALIALAIPTLGLHTSLPGFSSLPQSLPIVQTYDRLQTAFPGGPQPATVVVSAEDVTAPVVQQAIASFKTAALATGKMFDPIQVDVNPDKTVARISVPLAGDGTDSASNAALAALRGSVIPSTLEKSGEIAAYVTGVTAGSKDFNDKLKQRAPYVFGFVLLLAFLLLLVAFRSVVIALKSILLNLLSVGAAYGLLVLVFQHRWAEGILDFKSTGGIVSWLPLFLFVVLFGLSMDYHVFILSRVKELVDRGAKTDEAVAGGIRQTAGVVTSAAVVMVAVFAIFATLSTVDMKQLGLGLAAAVLLDATLVRAVLLPATMHLLGDWNWYLPKWLEWLPKFEIEGGAAHREALAATPGQAAAARPATENAG